LLEDAMMTWKDALVVFGYGLLFSPVLLWAAFQH
jgi:hypothetical protein